jgi:hypothetical protein
MTPLPQPKKKFWCHSWVNRFLLQRQEAEPQMFMEGTDHKQGATANCSLHSCRPWAVHFGLNCSCPQLPMYHRIVQ